MYSRGLYSEGSEMTCRFCLVLLCNDKPFCNDQSEGMGRRLGVIHFPVQFKQHPDPKGVTLKLVASMLKQQWNNYEKAGVSEFGVFFDYGSLFQHPRTDEQQQLFVESLANCNLWYAHALITVYLITQPDPEYTDLVPYHQRGWTSFEFNLTLLIKVRDARAVELMTGRRKAPCSA